MPDSRTINIAPLAKVIDITRPSLGELKFIRWKGRFRGEGFAKCCRFGGEEVLVRASHLELVDPPQSSEPAGCCGSSPSVRPRPSREVLMARLQLTEEELADALKE